MPTSNKYANLYSFDSEDEPVSEEIVDSKNLKPINTYFVIILSKAQIITPNKVLKKKNQDTSTDTACNYK